MEQPDFFDEPHVALRKQADAIRKTIAPKVSEIKRLEAEANKLCPHSETKETEQYYDGDYLNKAHTRYVVTCTFCGKKLKEHIKGHSWYG